MTRLLGQQERGAKEAHREQEKLGLRGETKDGPLRRGSAGTRVGSVAGGVRDRIGVIHGHSHGYG